MTVRTRTALNFTRPAIFLALIASTPHLAPAAVGTAAAPIPPPEKILSRLNNSHPRLLASAADFVQLKQRISADPQLQSWQVRLHDQAEEILAANASRYEIP